MKRIIGFLSLAALWVATTAAWTHTRVSAEKLPVALGNPPVSSAASLQSARFSPSENIFEEYLRQAAERSFSQNNLLVYSERFYGLERYQASAFELGMEGVGAGATLGLFTSAVATTAGFWDDDTSWYVVGAAAAVGAILGLKRGMEDPAKRTRYRWSADVGP
jgi:hypothetical protein